MYIFERVSLPEEIAEQQEQNRTEALYLIFVALFLLMLDFWTRYFSSVMDDRYGTPFFLDFSTMLFSSYFSCIFSLLLLLHLMPSYFSCIFILCHLCFFHRFNTPHTDKIELDFLGYRLQLAQVVIFLFFLQFLFCYCVSRFWSYR